MDRSSHINPRSLKLNHRNSIAQQFDLTGSGLYLTIDHLEIDCNCCECSLWEFCDSNPHGTGSGAGEALTLSWDGVHQFGLIRITQGE